MSRQPESHLVAACLDLLHAHGYMAIRLNQQGVPLHDGSGKMRPGPTRGVSDIFFGKGPIWGYVECKRQGNDLSRVQFEFLETVNNHGGVGLVVYDVVELKHDLDALKPERRP